MASGQEKTEKPTAKRLSEARKKGQVAKSMDLTTALSLGGIALTLFLYGAYFTQSLMRLLRGIWLHWLRHADMLTTGGIQTLMIDVCLKTIVIMLPFLLVPLVVGVAINLYQTQFLFSMQALRFSLDRLNPLNGFKRFFSQRSMVELAKGILKMAIVGAACYLLINGKLGQLMALSQMNFAQGWEVIFQILLEMSCLIALILFVMGLADYIYQRYQYTKGLRMTKQEVKDEHKNMEGDPKLKGRMRSVGKAMMRKRMLKAVPQADVVVTNPTHFSVAIQYDPDISPAPRVVAKGADELAFRIREMAKENKVPIVENKPLARSLYATVEVDHMIPPELFVAVAEVLAYVFRKNKGRGKPHVRRMLMGKR